MHGSNETPATKKKGDSLEKMLSLLDVFTPQAPIWSSEDLLRYCGSSRSTGYRYINLLVKAGLLAPVASGSYVLGSRIMELDLLIRSCDPIYLAGEEVLSDLAVTTKFSAFLSVLYNGGVMCVRSLAVPNAPRGLFQRGERKSLFLGAASRIILAYLPHHQLKVVFQRNQKAIARAGLGSDWERFLKTLKSYRSTGYCHSTGEVLPQVSGIAAPIFNGSKQIMGSLAIAMNTSDLDKAAINDLGEIVIKASERMTQIISEGETPMTRPARRVS